MLRTSIGIHTFMMSMFFSWAQAKELLDIFKEYSKSTEIIKYRGIGKERTIKNPYGNTFTVYLHYEIKFTEWGKGITWVISFIETKKEFKYGRIDVIFNPRLFSGDKNFITASNETHIDEIPNKYDSIVKEISDEIPPFSYYKLTRVDYCVNFDLKELRLLIPTERMMELMKRSNDYRHFKERLVYCKKSHRWEPEENCFYLITQSVNINCYWKYPHLKEYYPDTLDIEDSKDVIRFEIQCKSDKIGDLRKVAEAILQQKYLPTRRPSEFEIMKQLLSDAQSKHVVFDYFDKVIRPGNYYTLEAAISKCGSRKTLIETLKLINQKRGIHKAKKFLENEHKQAMESGDNWASQEALSNLNSFSYSLRELAEMGINPVTIPKEWNIGSEPGLMVAYEIMMEPAR